MGGGSSGGGGTTTSTSEASFPAEFRPLATSSVAQIQDAQKALPLVNFTAFQPAGVAGLSPMQQYVLSGLVPSTTQMPAGHQGLLQVPTTSGLAALGAMSAGNRTPESESAVDVLGPRLTRSPWPTASLTSEAAPAAAAPATAATPAAAPPPAPSIVDQLIGAMVATMPAQETAPSAFPVSAAPPVSSVVPGIGGPSVDVTQPQAVNPTASPLPPPMPAPAAASGATTTAQTAVLDKLVRQDAINQARDQFFVPGSSPGITPARQTLLAAGFSPSQVDSMLFSWENEYWSPPDPYAAMPGI